MKRPSLTFDTILIIAVVLYGVGVWLHIPYGGGRVYSDIVSVFQNRECNPICSQLPIPYVQAFVEYPIITAFFMYAMGALGSVFPGPILANYYVATCIFLLLPTLLLIRELRIIAQMRGTKQSRLLWFFIVTPTFLFMLLLNWYVIGTYFAMAAIRFHLQGRKRLSGFLIGLSALSNLITAAPALGLVLSESKVKQAVIFLGTAAATYLLANLPVYLLNPSNWLEFWTYQYHWYIEGSWIGLFMAGTSPLRHAIPPVVFGAFAAVMFYRRYRGEKDPLYLSFLSSFAFVFSTYVYTPQMNVFLLPFFVLLPIEPYYLEFLVWDALNSAIIVVGFSGFFQLFGIVYTVVQFGANSPIQLISVARSFWVGKFAAYDGLYRKLNGKKNVRERSSLETDRISTEAGS